MSNHFFCVEPKFGRQLGLGARHWFKRHHLELECLKMVSSGVEKLGYGVDSSHKCQNATLRSRPDIRHYTFKPCATGQVASGGNPKIKIMSTHIQMCVLSVFHVF